MRVKIQTVIGQEYTGDEFEPDDVDKYIESFDTTFTNRWQNVSSLALQIKGKTKRFNPAHIIWLELVR